MPFLPGRKITASDLSDLAMKVNGAHIGAAGFLVAENGQEQVVRNPRRQVPRMSAAASAAAYPRPVLVKVGGKVSGGGVGYGATEVLDMDYKATGIKDCTFFTLEASDIGAIPAGTMCVGYVVKTQAVPAALYLD